MTVSHYGASNPSILQHFHALEPPTFEFCDSFTFWSLQPLNFETVFHFGARTPKNAVLSSICGSGGPKMLYRRQFFGFAGEGPAGGGFWRRFFGRITVLNRVAGPGRFAKFLPTQLQSRGSGGPKMLYCRQFLAWRGGRAGRGSVFGVVFWSNHSATSGGRAGSARKISADPTTEPLRGKKGDIAETDMKPGPEPSATRSSPRALLRYWILGRPWKKEPCYWLR